MEFRRFSGSTQRQLHILQFPKDTDLYDRIWHSSNPAFMRLIYNSLRPAMWVVSTTEWNPNVPGRDVTQMSKRL
jgi:hypothetical protein